MVPLFSRLGLPALTVVALLGLLLLNGCTGTCPMFPGYSFRLGKSVPPDSLSATGSSSSAAELARSCSRRVGCSAFSTEGLLVLSVVNGDAWGNLTTAAGPCDGVYMRAELVAGGMGDDLNGLEVSHNFDLDVPYYPRVPWSACKELCLNTTGCRSVSFLPSEELCVMKTATCVEARLGSGCTQRHASRGFFLHADRLGTTDFITGTPESSVHYLGLTTNPGRFNDSEAACKSFNARLPSLHMTGDYRTVLLAVERAAQLQQQALAGPSSRNESYPSYPSFWLNGKHNVSTNRVQWLDGTRYVLAAKFTVEVPGGCAAVTVTNGTARLVVQPCDGAGFPLCAVYAPGNFGARLQADSSLTILFIDQMGSQDAVNFCAQYGAIPHRPVGVRGREVLAEITAGMAVDHWIYGYGPMDRQPMQLSEYSFNDGTPIPSDFWSQALPPGEMCVSAASGSKLRGWIYPNSCDDRKWAVCQWPTRSGVPPTPYPRVSPDATLPGWMNRVDLPARVRLLKGSAYLFITNPRSYDDGQLMCQQLGGNMASVHDTATDQLISQTWYDLDPPSNNFVLWGERRTLTYLGADTRGPSLAWLDNTPFDYTGDFFGTLKTNLVTCIMLNSFGPGGPARWEWGLYSECASRRRNITCTVPAKAYLQPSSAVVSGASLFELHLNTPRTFPDAQEACRARGGNLASPSMGRDLEALRLLIHRLQHEEDETQMLPSMWELWVGATTNKSATDLTWTDFHWVGNSSSLFDFPMWYNSFPPGRPVNFMQFAGARSAATLFYGEGNPMLTRRRSNISRPFLCEVDVQPAASALADDGTTYEVLTTPYALPYHAAEQVCQSRGGHLAGISSLQQLAAVSQLCSRALQELPRASRGGFESHDVPDGCWVGLYCPAGYSSDISFKDGFGQHGLHHLTGLQPAMLKSSACNATSDLLWLDSRSASEESLVEVMGAAGATLGPLTRCGLVRPGASNDSSSVSLAMAACKQFAAFVCEHGGKSAPPSQPTVSVEPARTAVSALVAEPIPEGSVRYWGCYTLLVASAVSPANIGLTANTTTRPAALIMSPTPLPMLLSSSATSLAQCYNLTRQAGLSYFTVVGGEACWAGAAAPGLPFLNVSDDSPCRQPCSGDSSDTASGQQQPGCATAGYTAVFATAATSPPPPVAATPYVCMTEQMLAAPNATLVGQLHVSTSQLDSCEALCSSLAACDMYTYDTRSGACLLLGVPAVASLSSLPVYDALWARITCIKASRLVAGASPRQLAASTSFAAGGRATHLCGPALGGQLMLAGVRSLSPRDGLPISDMVACALSCNANATCQGFAVWPAAGGVENGTLLCSTRTGIVVDSSYEWMATRPWVQLPESVAVPSDSTGAEGCLVLSRMVPPPPYACTDYVDAAGWELQRLPTSDEQACRDACDADDECSLYVIYSSPPSCSLRFRAFYDSKAWPAAVGTNRRPNINTFGTTRSCLHALRVLQPLASPARGFRNRRVQIGQDNAWHLCVPHMDTKGNDVFAVETFKDTVCGRECALNSDCTFFITTADSTTAGACYAKKAPLVFTMGDDLEYPDTGGITRLDLLSVLETCLNLERQLPRTPPSYTCAQQYGAAFAVASRNNTATAFACEALCDTAASCTAYTWMAHNGSCMLGNSSSVGRLSWAAAATGPSWLATQTCLHAPRLTAGVNSQASGQHVQANSAWHYCVPSTVSSASLTSGSGGGPDLLGAMSLPLAGNSSVNYAAVRACSQQCTSKDGCQMFQLVWLSSSDASPICLLQGWSSAAALVPQSPSTGASPSLTCLAMAADRAFPAVAGGLAHPRVRPAAVQSYRSKQYSVHMQLVSQSLAAAICQGGSTSGGGQLLSVNNPQETAVVAALLRPFLRTTMQPAAGADPQPIAFWTGLHWVGNGSSNGGGGCTGWCFSHGRTTNSTFMQTLLSAPGNSSLCGALSAGATAVGISPADCIVWSLPFVCEHEMPALPSNGTNTSYGTLQLFPAQAGYAEAVGLAAAAGAVMAVLDMSTAVPVGGRRRARTLLQTSASSGVVFTSLSSATAACGAMQLLSSGCWVQLQPPADACSRGSSAPRCGATALLLVDASSGAASLLQGLASLLGSHATSCAVAVVNGASGGSPPSYIRAPCSTRAAFLALVVEPEAPLRASASPSPPLTDTPTSPPASLQLPLESVRSGGLVGGAMAGAIVGSIVGAAVVVLLVAAVFVCLRRRPAAAEEGLAKPCTGTAHTRASSPPQSAQLQQRPVILSDKAGVHLCPDSPMEAGRPDSLTPCSSISKTAPTSAPTSALSPGAAFSTQTGLTITDSIEPDSHGTSNRSLKHPSVSQQVLQALVVTAEDPDHDDVTWRIDPKTDITWDVEAELGKGTFGVVYRGTYKGLPVAVKMVLRATHGSYDLPSLKSLLHEARILAKLRHPNIVTCYGGCITDNDVFIVEELMSKTLGQLIASTNDLLLPLETVLRVAIDIANGLFQLHPTIVHRDLKPDNVLLDTNGRAKISDFGLARFKMQSYLVSTKNFAAGTIPFMAPETFHNKINGISEKADIYALAIIIWAMLAGQTQPWAEYHYAAILFKVSVNGERPRLPEDPVRCPPRLASLMGRMWAQEPSARPGAGDVLKQLSIILREVTRMASCGSGGHGAPGSDGAAECKSSTTDSSSLLKL